MIYDLNLNTMKNQKLLEAIADISYIAGSYNYSSGNSRQDISEFIHWAEQFEIQHSKTDWDNEDYIFAIDDFTRGKLKEVNHM
jgi:hypothetical protein